VVNILILPIKDPFYYANEKKSQDVVSEREGGFLQGYSCTCFSPKPPPLLPLAATLET
jgi:hypothetical protein